MWKLDPSRRWTEELARFLVAAVIIFVIGWIASRVAPVLMPVLVSLLIAYFLDPLIDRFEERGISRTVGIVIVAAIALLLVGIFAWIMIPVLATEVVGAIEALPEWADETYAWAAEELRTRFDYDLEESSPELLTSASENLQQAASQIFGSLLDTMTSLLNVVLIPVFSFYFLRDWDKLKMRPMSLVPPRYQDTVLERARRMDSVVGEWVRGQIQVAMILGILYAIGLSITGVKLGFIIGIVAGLLNVIPYVGGAIGVALSLLMILINGGDSIIPQLIGATITFSVVQLLEGYLITPKLVGDKVGMSPVTVMIVLLLGGSLFGFFGLMLSIPVVAASAVLAGDAMDWYRGTRFYTGEPGPDDSPPLEDIAQSLTEENAAVRRPDESLADSDGQESTNGEHNPVAHDSTDIDVEEPHADPNEAHGGDEEAQESNPEQEKP